MSDFFSNINGYRMPEIVMNQGPLPSQGGLPPPLHDTPDGRINYNNTLLGDIEPYAYGTSQYISSDTSYINFPHRIPKVVPEIFIPTGVADTMHNIPLTHPVADSDIAFVMKMDRSSDICPLLGKTIFDRQRSLLTVDPFINLCTLNYLLAGLQVCFTPTSAKNSRWFQLLHDLDRKRWPSPGMGREKFGFNDLVHIVKNLVVPFGIVRGSEKQGGQSQGGHGPATWPACFITTMNIDGVDENIMNIWTASELPGGSKVVFRLKPCKIPRLYTLNHYKTAVRQSLQMNAANTDNGTNCVWQLVPAVFDMEFQKLEDDIPKLGKLPVNFGIQNITRYCPMQKAHRPDTLIHTRSWQDVGFWHIGLTQHKMPSLSPGVDHYYDDMFLGMRQPHLKMTFQPHWVQTPVYETPEVRKVHAKWFPAITDAFEDEPVYAAGALPPRNPPVAAYNLAAAAPPTAVPDVAHLAPDFSFARSGVLGDLLQPSLQAGAQNVEMFSMPMDMSAAAPIPMDIAPTDPGTGTVTPTQPAEDPRSTPDPNAPRKRPKKAAPAGGTA